MSHQKNSPDVSSQKKSVDFFTDFFFKLSVSFVSENQWKPTNLGVTPKDLPTAKNTKIGGCLLHRYIWVLCISHKIYNIVN